MTRNVRLGMLVALLVGLLGGILAAPAAPAAAQTTAPGLGYTEFSTTTITATETPSCDSDGGTFTFEVSGTASSTTYPGSFTETGTITLGEINDFGQQPILGLTITFTIKSPNGLVTGTKEIVPAYGSTPKLHGNCTTTYASGAPELRVSTFAFRRLRYTAQIETPDGRTCTTQGPSDLFSITKNFSSLNDRFYERLLSDVAAPLATCTGDEDTTAPVLTRPGTVTADATGPAGAAVTFAVSAEDVVDGAVTPACSAASGGVFPIGTTTVSCTATDAAGNEASGSFDVVVRGADAQLADLIAAVQQLNAKNGIVTSLDAKLANAQEALDEASAGDLGSACGKLSAFIHEVEAQAGDQIGATDAQTLLAAAYQIAAVLGC